MIQFRVVQRGMIVTLLVTTTVGNGCVTKSERVKQQRIERPTSSERPIEPISLTADLDQRRVRLGDELFHDVRLSHDNSIACASCHSLSTGGVDRLPTSVGIGGAVGLVNAPTVFNSGLFFRQFWDGRAKTLEEQANGPIHADAEMGSNWAEVIDKLNRDVDFSKRFSRVYSDGLTAENICDAIAIFERSLVTPNSRFDRHLKNDGGVLTEQEAHGYAIFRDYGCVSCHQGVAMGGNMFQRFGVMGDYFANRGTLSETDMGRFNVTGREADRHVFKVPTLRNIALTPPYFHDGSATTLEEAVQVMATYQLGRELNQSEVRSIVAFLGTLTGEYRGKLLN